MESFKNGEDTFMSTFFGEKIIMAAHRGDKKNCPENTLPAFKRAIEIGSDAIECDIHQTKDGVIVMMHDHDVDRTTDGTGRVCDLTFEEIRKLDAGIKFGEQFKGTKVPTFEEFLDLVEPEKDLLLNLEIKDYPQVEGDEIAFSTVDKVIAAVEARGMGGRIMFNSFSAQLLEYVNKKYPQYPLHGFFPMYLMSGIRYNPYDFLDYACLFPNHLENGKKVSDGAALCPAEDFEYLHERNVRSCVCFPVDTEENMKAAIDLGVKMFTCNDPENAIKILKKLGYR
jgi:glycerophosphoryl diester phosphodiesterase